MELPQYGPVCHSKSSVEAKSGLELAKNHLAGSDGCLGSTLSVSASRLLRWVGTVAGTPIHCCLLSGSLLLLQKVLRCALGV